MPAPIAPIAWTLARYAAVAVAAYAVTRAQNSGRRDQRAEDALDALDDGVHLHRDDDATRGALRWRRIVRSGPVGHGLAVDFAALARLRVSRF